MESRKKIIIIGAGFAGTGMGIRLLASGEKDFLILERDSEIGGTWRDNTYPGAACDVKSNLYSYSFELWPEWSHVYGHQEEILSYHHHCIEKYGLDPYIRLNHGVKSAHWEEATGQWRVTTWEGKVFLAKYVITGTGPLNKNKIPDFPGKDTFGGSSFHSADWDHSVETAGKQIVVIGTGASAIQIVPAVAKTAARVTVFQRTPPWVIHRGDRPVPEHKKKRYRKFPFLQALSRWRIYWQNEFTALGFVRFTGILKIGQKLALRHLKKAIRDPELRRKVTPTYTMGCKRVLRSDAYYPALTLENVDLVTDLVASIDQRGVRTQAGTHIPADVIVYATGFEASENMAPFEVTGRDGISLSEIWKQGGESYLGTTIHGFPNLFTLIGPNTGLGHNSMIHIIESQIQLVLSALSYLESNQMKAAEPRKEVQDQYNEWVQRRLKKTVWSTGGCQSWYLNGNGRNTTLWPGFTVGFRLKTKKFRPREYNLS